MGLLRWLKHRQERKRLLAARDARLKPFMDYLDEDYRQRREFAERLHAAKRRRDSQ